MTEDSESPQHLKPRRHRVLRGIAISLAVLLVVVATGGFFVYQHLNRNITVEDVAPDIGPDRPTEQAVEGPRKPVDILLLGSDTRKGQGGSIGGDTPGLSDATILLHVSADRKRTYGVSLPRDAMVQRPACKRKDGQGTAPAELSMFNAAYAVGGPACTIKTVEQLTGIRVEHFVVIDFKGFKKMVDALGGVEVCVPREVNDTTGNIYLPAGTYNVKGQRALDYVRVRHDIGTSENGDIGRMRRQQTFLAAMVNKAVSAGTLLNPVRLYKFLDEATKSLTTDPGLGSIGKMRSLSSSLDGINLDQVKFLTVPFEAYEPDPNRLQWAPDADRLWAQLRADKPLGKRFSGAATSAADEGKKDKKKAGSASPSPTDSASPSGSASPTPSAEATRVAAENGLCA